MKRIIWVAQDSKHRIISVWWKDRCSLDSWMIMVKHNDKVKYITKHYIEV